MSSRPPEERREDLIACYREMCDSHVCPLIATRTKLVFGAGNANADLMFVGEAPGMNEDLQGLPFVGAAGKFLDELLAGVGMERSDVFITNIICCRPPGNRDPLPEEIDACKPYLFRKIELIEPKVICTLGNFATKLLSGSPTGIMRCHGRPQNRVLGGRSVVLYPICHPAAGLRSTSVKQLLQEDFERLPELLAEHAPPEPEPAPEPEPPVSEQREQLGLFG